MRYSKKPSRKEQIEALPVAQQTGVAAHHRYVSGRSRGAHRAETMSSSASDLEHAQQLLNHLAPAQVAAVVHLMEVMLDPVSRALANAPLEDEEISEDENQAVARSKEWFKNNRGTSLEDVASGLGFTMDQIRNGMELA